MVEWFKWGSEYGRDLRTAALKAGKIVKAQGGTISFEELGIGKVEYSDYDGARVISKDGKHAISFDIYGRGENGITVTSEMKGHGERYGFDWEFLNHIGDYKTLSGAIKSAKKYWNMSGIQYNEKDFERI